MLIRRMTRLACLAAAVGALAGVSLAMVPGPTAPEYYQVSMHYGGFAPTDPPTPDTGMSDNLFRGTATARLELVGNHLIVLGSYSDLRGSILPTVANGVHIHHDPALYHLDTIVSGLENEGQNSGLFNGYVYLTLEQQDMLAQGRLYMDIHTAAFPEGEVRGTIVPVSAEAALVQLPLASR